MRLLIVFHCNCPHLVQFWDIRRLKSDLETAVRGNSISSKMVLLNRSHNVLLVFHCNHGCRFRDIARTLYKWIVNPQFRTVLPLRITFLESAHVFFPQWDPCNVVKTFKFVAKFYTVPCMPNLNLLALEVNRTTRGWVKLRPKNGYGIFALFTLDPWLKDAIWRQL